MQWILGVFAMRFNRFWRITGHVWGERFYSHIIENTRQYHEISSYIDENPLKAGLVNRIEEWAYGRFHLQQINCEGLITIPLPAYDCP
jgi:putative transposase